MTSDLCVSVKGAETPTSVNISNTNIGDTFYHPKHIILPNLHHSSSDGKLFLILIRHY